MPDPVPTGLELLIENIGSILTAFVDWFVDISAMLMSSEVVQLMVGLGIASLLIAILIKIIGKATFRRSGRRR